MGCWLGFGLLALMGLPLLVAGAVIRLSEKQLQKPTGSMGSIWLLVLGGLLSLPLLLFLVLSVVGI